MPASSIGRDSQGSSEVVTNVPTRESQHLETGCTKMPKCFSVELVTGDNELIIMPILMVWLCE